MYGVGSIVGTFNNGTIHGIGYVTYGLSSSGFTEYTYSSYGEYDAITSLTPGGAIVF